MGIIAVLVMKVNVVLGIGLLQFYLNPLELCMRELLHYSLFRR